MYATTERYIEVQEARVLGRENRIILITPRENEEDEKGGGE
jgi:hypothetical protein